MYHIKLNTQNPNPIFKITIDFTKYTQITQTLSNVWKCSEHLENNKIKHNIRLTKNIVFYSIYVQFPHFILWFVCKFVIMVFLYVFIYFSNWRMTTGEGRRPLRSARSSTVAGSKTVVLVAEAVVSGSGQHRSPAPASWFRAAAAARIRECWLFNWNAGIIYIMYKIYQIYKYTNIQNT